MRLTEAPRKLAEMRPEVAWTEPVQATLDKALQRDVNARFASATEFGRALSSALEAMDSKAPVAPSAAAPRASSGNATLPVTRVAKDRPAAAGNPMASPAKPAPTRRRFAAAYAAGGAVLVAVLIGAAMVMNRPGAKAAAADSVTPERPAPSDGKVSDTSRYRQRIDSAPALPAGNPTSTTVRTPPPADVGAALDSLEKLVSGDVTPAEAGRVIRRVEQMKGRIKGDEQLVQAGIVIALAESSRGNNAAACAALRSVQPIAPVTTRARQVERTMSVCN